MWIIACVYFFSIVPKCIAVIKSFFDAEKDENFMLRTVEAIENIATLFVLVFVAMENVGAGMYISMIVMCLCVIVKRTILKKCNTDSKEATED